MSLEGPPFKAVPKAVRNKPTSPLEAVSDSLPKWPSPLKDRQKEMNEMEVEDAKTAMDCRKELWSRRADGTVSAPPLTSHSGPK